MAQNLSYVIEDRGDASGGLQPFSEEVSISFLYGGHDSETMAEFERLVKAALSSCFGYGNFKVTPWKDHWTSQEASDDHPF